MKLMKEMQRMVIVQFIYVAIAGGRDEYNIYI